MQAQTLSEKPNENFCRAYKEGQSQLLSLSMVNDLETPVSAYLKLNPDPAFSFLLESIEGGAIRGRYSFIGLDPDLLWECHKGVASHQWRAEDGTWQPAQKDTRPALQSLRQLLADSKIRFAEDTPPMAAGVYGYLGYEMVRLFENLAPPSKPPLKDQHELPIADARLMRPRLLLVFDSIANILTLISPVRPRAGITAEMAYLRAWQRLQYARQRLQAPLPVQHAALTTAGLKSERTQAEIEHLSNTGREEFMQMVEEAKAYIRAGDIFQIVLSHRFTLPIKASPFNFYRALRRLNPSPFLFHLVFEKDFALVGASPEILVRLRDKTVTVRPIAGTRRRGKTPEEDIQLAADLLADPKELAEHLMLLDLGRNDVGRVSKPGSVKVTAQNIIERYSHVMHIVSNVEGELKNGVDVLDALAAGFPAGTVSGAPKIRAMQIIDTLEKEQRGAYGGGVGYFGANDDLDSAITLRTGCIIGDKLYIQAGAGIVYDSNPEAEWQETCNKAMALLRAAEAAEML